MRYTRTMRNLHLWVGLTLAVFILIEACTGLIQSEPWLIGASQSDLHQPRPGFNLFLLTNMIHEGQIGSLDFRWLIDITALGIIILTLTGLYLSLPYLKFRKRLK